MSKDHQVYFHFVCTVYIMQSLFTSLMLLNIERFTLTYSRHWINYSAENSIVIIESSHVWKYKHDRYLLVPAFHFAPTQACGLWSTKTFFYSTSISYFQYNIICDRKFKKQFPPVVYVLWQRVAGGVCQVRLGAQWRQPSHFTILSPSGKHPHSISPPTKSNTHAPINNGHKQLPSQPLHDTNDTNYNRTPPLCSGHKILR